MQGTDPDTSGESIVRDGQSLPPHTDESSTRLHGGLDSTLQVTSKFISGFDGVKIKYTHLNSSTYGTSFILQQYFKFGEPKRSLKGSEKPNVMVFDQKIFLNVRLKRNVA